jgi:hypothetical protein
VNGIQLFRISEQELINGIYQTENLQHSKEIIDRMRREPADLKNILARYSLDNIQNR